MTIPEWLWQKLIGPVYWWRKDGTLIDRVQRWRQRRAMGFDETITWDLDCAIGDWMVPRLKRFKKLCVTLPPRNTDHLTKEEVEKIQRERPNDLYLSEEEWNEILDEIIAAFEFISSKGMHHASGRNPALYEAEMERYRKGMKLFGQYLLHLWW